MAGCDDDVEGRPRELRCHLFDRGGAKATCSSVTAVCYEGRANMQQVRLRRSRWTISRALLESVCHVHHYTVLRGMCSRVPWTPPAAITASRVAQSLTFIRP
jgi:hypothetical protein